MCSLLHGSLECGLDRLRFSTEQSSERRVGDRELTAASCMVRAEEEARQGFGSTVFDQTRDPVLIVDDYPPDGAAGHPSSCGAGSTDRARTRAVSGLEGLRNFVSSCPRKWTPAQDPCMSKCGI